jgi:hypothetical protein
MQQKQQQRQAEELQCSRSLSSSMPQLARLLQLLLVQHLPAAVRHLAGSS